MNHQVRLRAGTALLGAAALGATVLGSAGSAVAVPVPVDTFSISGSIHGVLASPDDVVVARSTTGESDDVYRPISNGTYSLDGLQTADSYTVCVQHFHGQDERSYGPVTLGCIGGDDQNSATAVSSTYDDTTDITVLPVRWLSGSVSGADGRQLTVQIDRLGADGTYGGYDNGAAQTTDGDGNVDSTYRLPVTIGHYKISFTDDGDDEGTFDSQYLGHTTEQADSNPIDVTPGDTDITIPNYAMRQHTMSIDRGPDHDYVTAPTTGASGAPVVGQALTATPGGWNADCMVGRAFTYTWYRGDETQVSQPSHDPHYVVKAADVDHVLQVQVTGASDDCLAGGAREHGYSDYSDVVVAPSAPAPAPAPTTTVTPAQPGFDGGTVAAATGRAKVGGTLAAPSLANLPADAQVSYQWFRAVKSGSGHRVKVVAITGARGVKYKVKKKDKGAQVFVTLTVRSASYAKPATVSSKKLRVH